MEFEYLFVALFLFVAGYFVFQMIKHGGLRGALFRARLVGTVGELDLGRRHGIRTRLKVHRLESRGADSPTVGVELVATSYGSFGMMPISLTRDQATELAALLTKALTETDIHAPTG